MSTPSAATLDVWRHVLEGAPEGFAITRGPAHVLVFANDAFNELLELEPETAIGRSLTEAGRRYQGLVEQLDRVLDEALVLRDEPVRVPGESMSTWLCTAWPLSTDVGIADGLVVELRVFQPEGSSLAMQRGIAERMLLGALHEQESAEVARSSQRAATFLATESRRLAESIDESTTRQSVAGLHLPTVAAWCIVDVVEEEGGVRRLAIVHPDVEKEAALRDLLGPAPRSAEQFGVEAVRGSAGPVVLLEGVQDALGLGSLSQTEDEIADIEVGSLLTVPMRSHGRLLGAITFVGTVEGREYTPEEVELAGELAARSAVALENARLHREAIGLRAEAQEANRVKSEFLGHVSHELRTPLNAIGGFVDLIAMGVYGPLTPDQKQALERITANQKQLLLMINDLLTFMQAESGKLAFNTTEFSVRELLLAMLEMISPTIDENGLISLGVKCEEDAIARADRERTQQILLNLLSNAVKFTPAGGEIVMRCDTTETSVLIHVTDTGIGITPRQLKSIFEPFVQAAQSLTEKKSGVGLGLAISRDLALRMGGQLTAVSTPGEGSRFTLRLPRVSSPAASA